MLKALILTAALASAAVLAMPDEASARIGGFGGGGFRGGFAGGGFRGGFGGGGFRAAAIGGGFRGGFARPGFGGVGFRPAFAGVGPVGGWGRPGWGWRGGGWGWRRGWGFPVGAALLTGATLGAFAAAPFYDYGWDSCVTWTLTPWGYQRVISPYCY